MIKIDRSKGSHLDTKKTGKKKVNYRPLHIIFGTTQLDPVG